MALTVENLPVKAGDIRNVGLSPDWEDPLKKEMATHSCILAWRILRMEEPGRLQSHGGHKNSAMTKAT